MQPLFESVNEIFRFIIPVSDWLWEFPTNYSWYKSIPVLGQFSLAVILLVGTGIYFTVRTGFIQVTHFKSSLSSMLKKRSAKNGISTLSAFFMGTAMRVGPGNIIGVTGAIAAGGPGALFWLWVSAFFGMATAYAEGVLAQIFKEKKGDEYVGGLSFYGKKLLKNKAVIGTGLSLLYILYALFCLPAQSFNTISSVGEMAGLIANRTFGVTSGFTVVTAALIVIITLLITFGGIKKISKTNNMLVPVMAVAYCAAVMLLIVLNLNRIPYFFTAVFSGAFTPDAIFGGIFGVVLMQGVKRGLMANEAGQGTITMAAASSDASHPCDQGCVESTGVFFDTIVCTLTGFVVIMGRMWTGQDSEAWLAMDRLPKFLASVSELAPGSAINTLSLLLMAFCIALFAYTCVISFISFAEIAGNRISKNKTFINSVRAACMVFIVFGLICNMAGLDLGNLWAFSDLANILIVFANVPLLYIGSKYVFRATAHFKRNDGTPFCRDIIGTEASAWEEKKIASKTETTL
jgi:AGCS family alanine or glycine:cation symporter